MNQVKTPITHSSFHSTIKAWLGSHLCSVGLFATCTSVSCLVACDYMSMSPVPYSIHTRAVHEGVISVDPNCHCTALVRAHVRPHVWRMVCMEREWILKSLFIYKLHIISLKSSFNLSFKLTEFNTRYMLMYLWFNSLGINKKLLIVKSLDNSLTIFSVKSVDNCQELLNFVDRF